MDKLCVELRADPNIILWVLRLQWKITINTPWFTGGVGIVFFYVENYSAIASGYHLDSYTVATSVETTATGS